MDWKLTAGFSAGLAGEWKFAAEGRLFWLAILLQVIENFFIVLILFILPQIA